MAAILFKFNENNKLKFSCVRKNRVRLGVYYTGCTLIRTHPYPYDVPLSVRFLVEMKTLISLNAYVDVYPYPYVVPLSERFLAELRCTDKGTPSVHAGLNIENDPYCAFYTTRHNFEKVTNEIAGFLN
jgi:hypothetical protein